MDQEIAQFTAITGADTNAARFYLESANGDVEAAMTMYYENGPAAPAPVHATNPTPIEYTPLPTRNPAPQTQMPAQRAPTTLSGRPAPVAAATPASAKPTSAAAQPKRGGIATLSDYNSQPSQGGEEGEDEDEEEGQRYYAGGSERSGQQVIDPHRKPKKDITAEIMSKAKDMGAQSADEYAAEKRKETFQGAGYRLGSTNAVPAGPLPETVKKERTVTLTFYRDGFTLDEGPLRRFDDPANQEFLSAINSGRVPRELSGEDYSANVTVNLIDKKGEEYKETPKKFSAFVGQGRSLAASSASSSSTPAPAAAAPAASRSTFKLDETQPITTIQIRLHDGTRLVAKFNHTHTVADIRGFVESAQPGSRGLNYDLSTTFPRKVLSDVKQTIAEAGLLNSAIVQSLK